MGHSAHHLKQLYEYMSLIGLEPDSPLGQDDFEGTRASRQFDQGLVGNGKSRM